MEALVAGLGEIFPADILGLCNSSGSIGCGVMNYRFLRINALTLVTP